MDSTVKACLLSCLLGLATAQLVWPCPYEDSYCEVKDTQNDEFELAGVTSASTVDEVAELCYAECNAPAAGSPECKGFTVVKNGNRPPVCHLLREPCSVNLVDDCIGKGYCQSGPNDCDAAPVACPVLTALSDDKVRWQCTDIATNPINPYTEEPPVGTVCYQMCPSWKSADGTTVARLESTCTDNAGTGEWSATQNYDDTELDWPKYTVDGASYPTPDAVDADALGCGCQDLALVWPYDGPDAASYDPNAEDAAEFICDTVVDASNDFKLITGNTCVLFCDDHYVATATCLNGEWSGNPEWGFWCYDEPNTE